MQLLSGTTLLRIASLVRAMASALITLFHTLRGNLPPDVRDDLAATGIATAERIRKAASIFARYARRKAT